MMRALPADERRVLLAHEQAHLSQRHYLYVQVAGLAAAADPLLRPLAAAVRAGVERWADEAAATEIGDRRLVARALARAGLAQAAARRPSSAPGSALRATDDGVAARARALLADPPPPRRAVAAALFALIVAIAASTVLTAHDTEGRFERAQAVYALTTG